MGISSASPTISVIIPTYNRSELLERSLESLMNQTLPRDIYEVVVVNDGSEDSTEEVCRYYSGLMNLKYAYQENSGISAAKNLGVFLSSGPVILFFDDDDVADRELLIEHLKFHVKYPMENIACLGYTTWHPEISITPVMKYITEIGQFLFSYINLEDNQELDFTYFWGGRTSCKRSLLVKHGVFNQDFRYIIEDIELGFRLSRFGLRVIFNKNAKSFMVRPITYDQFCSRCERQGRALYLFNRLHSNPIVENYCMVHGAEIKWRAIKDEIEKIRNKVQYLESLVISETLAAKESSVILNELYKLYGMSFQAFKLKGIVEAKKDSELKPFESSIAGEISDKDLMVFKKKWDTIKHPSESNRRVLVMDYFFPMYDRASGSLRIFNILKLMKELGYYVTFMAMNNELEMRYASVLEGLEIETKTLNYFIKRSNIFDINTFSSFLKERDFNFAIIEFWNLAKDWIPLLRKLHKNMSIIVDSVDIHFIREIREAELVGDKNLIKKAFQNKELEILTYRNADRVWVVTENDKEAIKGNIGDVFIDVIPNIHDKIDFVKAYEDTQDLLFVGNFRHSPNRDAVFYLCKEIFPMIKERLRDVRLFIVGNEPQEDIKSLASQDIIVTGYVEDISPYMKKARVSVAPLRYGAGMKGKIGEALSWGLPVVTTSIGAEGMGLIDGTHILIADEAKDFADKVITLYNDMELWNKLSEKGKAYINENFSLDSIKKRIEKIFLIDSTERIELKNCENPFISEKKINFPEPNFKDKLVSVVIPVKNNWGYTKVCLDSISRYTDVPYETIIVDNGSDEPLFKNLKTWKERNPKIKVRYLSLNKNKGFAGGCNEGAALASGDYLVFLNNDTLVTPGWLQKLIKPLAGDTTIGITGPMSNYINGRQKIDDCPLTFSTPEQVNFGKLVAYASDISNKNKNKYIFTEVIMGLCLAIKKELFDAIGGFDEQFYPGNFEDSDLSMRIHLRGLKPLICKDAFVYHFGNKTFMAQKDGYRVHYKRNLKVFMEKWHVPVHLDEESMYHKILNEKNTSKVNIICDFSEKIRNLICMFEKKTVTEIVDYYINGKNHQKMPLIIVSDAQRLEQAQSTLQNAYPNGELDSVGDITLFAGEIKDIFDSIETEKRLFVYTWKDKIDEDMIKSEKFLVI